MAKKKVFVSFDYENDKRYKFLLTAWNAHPDFEFSFSDSSAKEIKSDSVAVVKNVLSRYIGQATYTLVLVGRYANSLHPDRKEIGYRNWQIYEIAKSKESRNNIVAVKLNNLYRSPDELKNAGVSWARSFTEDSVVNALSTAS